MEQPSFSVRELRREVGAAVYRSRRYWKARTIYIAVFRLLLLVCAVLMLLAAIGSFAAGELGSGAGFLLIAAAEIWLAMFWNRIWMGLTGRLTLKSLKGPGNTCFYDDYLEDLDDGVCLKWQYAKVAGLYEGDLCFYVFLNERIFLILQKRCFTLGTPEQFRTFMETRCGSSFLPLREEKAGRHNRNE